MVKQKIRLSFILIILGVVVFMVGGGIFTPMVSSIVSLQTPIASVGAEGITPVQATSLFAGFGLIVIGVILYLLGK